MKLPLPLLLAVLAALCAIRPAVGDTIDVKKPPEQIERIRLRQGELPVVSLNADILYRVLVAEVALQRERYDLAARTLLDLSRDTSDPRLAKRAFQAAIAERDLALALQAAQQWALLDPTDPEAVATSLALAASNGQTSGLAQALWTRIDKAKDKDQAIAQASSIVSKMADKVLALEVLEKALHPSVRSLPIAHLALADAAWAASDAARAQSEAQQALDLDPRSEAAAQRVLEYGMKVDPDQAIRKAQEFADRNPDSRKLQLLLVNRRIDRHDFDAALAQVRKMRRHAPEDFDLLYTEAEVNVRAERYDDARRLLQEYISVQTQRRRSVDDRASNARADASDARLLLVQIAEKQGRLDDAIRELDLIDDPALRFQARVHKAVLQGKQGNLTQARATILSLRPQDVREKAVAALTLSTIYRDAGRTDDAVAVLVKADAELPDTAEIKYDLAMLYERQGRFDQFETLMRRVIELAPDNANAYNALGYTFADQNRELDEAQDLLERALDLDPDNPYILDSVGWYLYRRGDDEAALDYLQRSYDALASADVAAHLGEVLWHMSRQDEARRVWQEGLLKEPDNDTLLKTVKRLGVQLQ